MVRILIFDRIKLHFLLFSFYRGVNVVDELRERMRDALVLLKCECTDRNDFLSINCTSALSVEG